MIGVVNTGQQARRLLGSMFMKPRNSSSALLCRSLAVAYCIVGIVPLLFGLVFGGMLAGAHWGTPTSGMSATMLLLVATQFLLPTAWGVWLVTLAVRLWQPGPQLANPLTWTSVLMLAFGGLNCVWGYLAMQAAERSASNGGGLLSPVAMLPLLIGLPLVVLALLSVLVARRVAASR